MGKLIYRKDKDFKELVEKYHFTYKSDKKRNRYIENSDIYNNALIIIEETREVLIYDFSCYATIPLTLLKLLGDEMLEWEIEK